jgi:hypothetical protein
LVKLKNNAGTRTRLLMQTAFYKKIILLMRRCGYRIGHQIKTKAKIGMVNSLQALLGNSCHGEKFAEKFDVLIGTMKQESIHSINAWIRKLKFHN